MPLHSSLFVVLNLWWSVRQKRHGGEKGRRCNPCNSWDGNNTNKCMLINISNFITIVLWIYTKTTHCKRRALVFCLLFLVLWGWWHAAAQSRGVDVLGEVVAAQPRPERDQSPPQSGGEWRRSLLQVQIFVLSRIPAKSRCEARLTLSSCTHKLLSKDFLLFDQIYQAKYSLYYYSIRLRKLIITVLPSDSNNFTRSCLFGAVVPRIYFLDYSAPTALIYRVGGK